MIIEYVLSLLDISTILVFLLVFLLSRYLLNAGGEEPDLPPGPRPLPIVGNMLQLAGHKKQWLLHMKWQRTYGPMFMVKIGNNRMIVVMGWKLVREGLIDKGHLLTDRPEWLYIVNQVFQHTGIFWSNGATWRDLRKFAVVHLRDFGVGKKSLEERIQEEANMLADAIATSGGSALNPRTLLTYAISNIICGIIFGNRFDYDDPEFQELYSYLDFLFKNLGLQIPENFFPFLRYLPVRSPAVPILKNDKKIKEYFHKRIEDHRETFDPSNPRDFIDMYLKLKHENKNTETLTEENVFRVMVDLFLGGSETTATTLLWVLLYLIRFPDVQARCHEELDTVVGSRQVSLSDKANLPFVMATIQEVQRIASTVPFAAPHVASEDFKLGGYRIPKNSLVLFHIYSAHHDEEFWEEPHAFRPERWLEAGGKLLKRESFVPFSLGPRTCPGEPLAKMELFLFITTLLQKFSFHTLEKRAPPSLDAEQPGFPLQPQPFQLCAVRR